MADVAQFYKNGVPKWRGKSVRCSFLNFLVSLIKFILSGTGYYYSRYRPGLGVSTYQPHESQLIGLAVRIDVLGSPHFGFTIFGSEAKLCKRPCPHRPDCHRGPDCRMGTQVDPIECTTKGKHHSVQSDKSRDMVSGEGSSWWWDLRWGRRIHSSKNFGNGGRWRPRLPSELFGAVFRQA